MASAAILFDAYGLSGDGGMDSVFGNCGVSPYALLLAANMTRCTFRHAGGLQHV